MADISLAFFQQICISVSLQRGGWLSLFTISFLDCINKAVTTWNSGLVLSLNVQDHHLQKRWFDRLQYFSEYVYIYYVGFWLKQNSIVLCRKFPLILGCLISTDLSILHFEQFVCPIFSGNNRNRGKEWMNSVLKVKHDLFLIKFRKNWDENMQTTLKSCLSTQDSSLQEKNLTPVQFTWAWIQIKVLYSLNGLFTEREVQGVLNMHC